MILQSTKGTAKVSLIELARGADTPHNQLEAMLTTPNMAVAVNIAQRSDLNTSESLAERLATDNRVAVRLRVASNTSTPRRVLDMLTEDENADVRNAARNTIERMESGS